LCPAKNAFVRIVLHNFHVQGLFVPRGGHQNKNESFWSRGTTSGNFRIF
jgi:hypothetical protein